MRAGQVFLNNRFAGILIEESKNIYIFRYDSAYYNDPTATAVSLTLPKSNREYRSAHLFPFFFNMLAEGVNKQLQNRQLRIDEEDSFGLLLATTAHDTIGAVTIKPLPNDELTRDK